MNNDNFTLFEEGYAPSDLGGPTEGAAAASGMKIGHPAMIAGMTAVDMLKAHKKAKEVERQERYQAKVSHMNRTQNALVNLSNIGKALKL